VLDLGFRNQGRLQERRQLRSQLVAQHVQVFFTQMSG
jgi:hypothetical protein